MTTVGYSSPVLFSERNAPIKPLGARERLLQQALFRDQVQAAIYQLIRGYEVSTGLTVTRMDYDRSEGRVSLEALPL
jgi:hypothetical protein